MIRPATIALNEAALHHLLYEIQQGNLNACKAMGLDEDVITRIINLPPTKLSRLVYSPVCWGRFAIDALIFNRLIDGLDDNRETFINRAIRLGASSPMMMECFGLTHSETAQRRRLLQVPTRRGRLLELDDAQKKEIWLRWQTLTMDCGKPESQLSQIEKLDLMMMIAEEQSIILASIWQEIQSYAEAVDES
ncbi:MAG: DUF2857 domain-containing protein [Betaproteobacteria bacterium]|nr:DUF2857 domain-containing protein [Betaproteobacteria bacterium]